MQECGVKRLLVTSRVLLFRSAGLLDRFLRFVARHKARNAGLMEQTICASNLEWTIARLGFLNDKNSMDFRLAEGAFPDDGSISRAAVASFLLSEAKKSKYLYKGVGLCG